MELKSTLMASSTPINKNKIMAIKHSKKTISTILSHTIIHTSIGDQANKSRYLHLPIHDILGTEKKITSSEKKMKETLSNLP